MIAVTTPPRNSDHYLRLMDFVRDVLAVCDELGIEPVLDGSLAVFARAHEPIMEVRDVDFSCDESELPRLLDGLRQRGIQCEIRSWHVLQARRNSLKVEFGAIEHWMQGIPVRHERMKIAGIAFRVLTLEGLREQYRRGLENTAQGAADDDPGKHRAIAEKVRLLDALQSE